MIFSPFGSRERGSRLFFPFAAAKVSIDKTAREWYNG